MDMRQLDINQCPDDYHTPNAFKNTHKCDRRTSYVSLHLTHPPIIPLMIRFVSVCADSGSRLRERRLQMRMSARLRVSFRGFNHVLRRTACGVRVPEHHEQQGDSLRSVQVPISWCCWHQRAAHAHRWLHHFLDFLHASPSPINCCNNRMQ